MPGRAAFPPPTPNVYMVLTLWQPPLSWMAGWEAEPSLRASRQPTSPFPTSQLRGEKTPVPGLLIVLSSVLLIYFSLFLTAWFGFWFLCIGFFRVLLLHLSVVIVCNLNVESKMKQDFGLARQGREQCTYMRVSTLIWEKLDWTYLSKYALEDFVQGLILGKPKIVGSVHYEH